MIKAGGTDDVVISPDQSRLYVATTSGTIETYDLQTYAKLATWTVGTSLGGMSISEDGSYLLVTERSPANGLSTLYKVSTATGAQQTVTLPGSGFYDVQVVDSHTAVVTGGENLAQKLDLDTLNFTSISGSVYYANRSVLTRDGHLTLLAEPGISNGPLFVYDSRAGSIVANGTIIRLFLPIPVSTSESRRSARKPGWSCSSFITPPPCFTRSIPPLTS